MGKILGFNEAIASYEFDNFQLISIFYEFLTKILEIELMQFVVVQSWINMMMK